jgi:hypothetical protein
MSGTTVVFKMFRDVAADEGAVAHLKQRLLPALLLLLLLLLHAAAVVVVMHIHRRTAPLRIFSVPIGTSALRRRSHE